MYGELAFVTCDDSLSPPSLSFILHLSSLSLPPSLSAGSPTSPDLPPAMPDPMEESPAPLAMPTPKQLHSLSPRPEMSPLSSPATKDAKSEEQVPVETDEGGAVGENSETEETLEMDEAIVVKKEENTSWLPPPLDPAPTVCPRSPPSPTPPPSPPTSTAAVDALLCAERLPSNVTELKPAPDLCTPVKPNQDRLPPTLSGRSSDETLSSCGSSSKAASDTCSSPERPLTPPSPVKAEPSSPSSRSASEPRRSSREREDDKSSYGSSEEKDGCSPTLGRHSKQALLPEARKRGRDHRETEEEYQERKRARRTGMNFLLRIGASVCACVCWGAQDTIRWSVLCTKKSRKAFTNTSLCTCTASCNVWMWPLLVSSCTA